MSSDVRVELKRTFASNNHILEPRKYSKFEEFLKTKAVNFVNAGTDMRASSLCTYTVNFSRPPTPTYLNNFYPLAPISHPGDPCPRAWSAVDLRAVIREAAEAMKEQLKETARISMCNSGCDEQF